MKNIILQHWTGEMNELGECSSANISKYAKKLGADYRLLRGNLFRPKLKTPWPPVQKLYMLDKMFDEYDMVVMLDIDMFTRKGMEENVFTDIKGVGLHTEVQRRLLKSRKAGQYADPNAPWWGGAIYRLDRKLRQTLRSKLRENEIDFFCSRRHGGDEGLIHRLASLAKINPRGTYFSDRKWCHGSFEAGIEDAALIHIRTKIAPKGPKRPKIENYKGLVKRRLIEE